MACPYFYPTARLESGCWVIPPRLPLGDAYAGECRASTAQFQPGEQQLREFCNVGYGRGSCEHFPLARSADAIRFHMRGESDELILIQSVAEKECWPAGSVGLEYSISSRGIRGTEDPILARQAVVFVESYLRRKEQVLAIGA